MARFDSPVLLYFDHNVKQAVIHGLRLRGLHVLTAFDDRAHRLSDPELLDRATALGRVLVSSDMDLVIEARRRQNAGVAFAGVLFVAQSLPARVCIDQIELIAKAGQADEYLNSVNFLPLR